MNSLEQACNALYEAYCKASGRRPFLSYQRKRDLEWINERGITPDELTAVLTELRKLMRQKPDFYGPQTIEWGVCMARIDKLEDRVDTIRERQRRKEAARPKPQVARTDSTGVTRLDEAPMSQPSVIDVAATFRGMADNLEGVQRTAS